MTTAVIAENLPRSERTRRSILDGTLRVIAGGGLDAVTHRRVAAEARVSPGSTTYYFDSREDLIREAFRHYMAEVGTFLAELEGEFSAVSADNLVELLVEMARREFLDPGRVLTEYELILYCTRDEDMARAFNTWDRGLEARLAEILERLGAGRPIDGARTVIELVRGFELERLTRTSTTHEDLRRRLHLVVGALIAPPPASSAGRTKKGEKP